MDLNIYKRLKVIKIRKLSGARKLRWYIVCKFDFSTIVRKELDDYLVKNNLHLVPTIKHLLLDELVNQKYAKKEEQENEISDIEIYGEPSCPPKY